MFDVGLPLFCAIVLDSSMTQAVRHLLLLLSVACVTVAFQISFSRPEILRPFHQRGALKIISGLKNFDSANVGNVAWAASNGGASLVDIACNADLVQMVKSLCAIPVCVSSINPHDFVDAVRAGADMVEIGNFDGFYEEGMDFPAEDVIRMAEETRRLLPGVPMSVTIPHRLTLSDQVTLAKYLELIGTDIIQTEGKVGVANEREGLAGVVQRATPTLTAASAISKAVRIPVLCASGLTDVTAPLALAAGASGVGIGTMVNKLTNREDMLRAVVSIASGMKRFQEDTNSDVNVNANENRDEAVQKRKEKYMSSFSA